MVEEPSLLRGNGARRLWLAEAKGRYFKKALVGLEPGEEFLLLVKDREGTRFVVIRPRG